MFRARSPADLSPGKSRHTLSRRLSGLQGQAEIKEYLAFTGDRSPDHPNRSAYLFITYYLRKNKVAPVHDIKAYMGRGGINPLILNSTLDVGHHYRISVMQLGYLLTRSGLTFPEFSLTIRHHASYI